MPRATPPAKTAPSSQAPQTEILEVHQGGKPPQWPKPSVPLKGPALEYYYDLLNSVWAAKGGVLSSEIRICEMTAGSYGDHLRWRKVADHLVDQAGDDGPNFSQLSMASSRAEAALRAHSRGINMLSLEGDHLGVQRSKKLRAATGHKAPDSKWGDIL